MNGDAPHLDAEAAGLEAAPSSPVAQSALALPVESTTTNGLSDHAVNAGGSALSRSASLIASATSDNYRSSRSQTRKNSVAAPASCPSLEILRTELALLSDQHVADSSSSSFSSAEINGKGSDASALIDRKMVLELADGTAYEGISFGAQGKSVSGECVFQTGQSDASAVVCPLY